MPESISATSTPRGFVRDARLKIDLADRLRCFDLTGTLAENARIEHEAVQA